MKKILAVLLVLTLINTCLGLALADNADAATGFRYDILKNGTVEIIQYSGRAAELEIPKKLDGRKVTGIRTFAFVSCNNLKKVIIPDSVTSIGDYAFAGCISLTAVTIPNSVTDIGVNPFGNCDKLTEIIVSPDHKHLAVVDGVLFSKPDQRLVCYPCAFTAEHYKIPDGTGIIGEDAFTGSNLTEITIPDSVTDIGNGAFGGCRSLTEITIPDSVISIGDGAFWDCDSLTGITIPDSVTGIGPNPFLHCDKLTEIIVSPDHPCLAVIDGVLFSRPDQRLVYCPKAFTEGHYEIPDGIRIIDEAAFEGCDSLTGITIPDSVTSIGDDAFAVYHNGRIVPNPDLTVTVGRDSCAEQYCKKNGIKYTYPDAPEGLNN